MKPAVGTGSRMVARYTSDQSARALSHLRALHRRGEAALLQPYVESFARQGEAGVYVIDGHATHMIRKSSVLEANVGPREDFELSFRQRVNVVPLEHDLVSFAENVFLPRPTDTKVTEAPVRWSMSSPALAGDEGSTLTSVPSLDPWPHSGFQSS